MTAFLIRSVLFGALLGLPAIAAARGQGGVQGEPRCQEAAAVVAGRSQALDKDTALGLAGRCGPAGAQSLAEALRRARATSDRRELGKLVHAMTTLVDAGLFEAALAVAGDRGAAVPARVYAFGYLMRLARPGSVIDYDDLSAGLDDAGVPRSNCSARDSAGQERISSLPPDWEARRQQLVRRVFEDKAEPAGVRSAAVCAY